jgi:acetamidase/formamidase
MKSVEIDRTKLLRDQPATGHNRLHPDIPPILEVDEGEEVVLETRDGCDGYLGPSATTASIATMDAGAIHPLTGPVLVKGARPGDVLEIEMVDVLPQPYAFTAIVPGLGFLRDLYTTPYLVKWRIADGWATSPELPGVRIPGAPFMGVIGLAPSHDQLRAWTKREQALLERGGLVMAPDPAGAVPGTGRVATEGLRTIPPRENGGNMDIKQITKGSTLSLPVTVEGALFSGSVRGSADISLVKDDPHYSAKLILSRIDFPRLTDLYFKYQTARGKLSATYDFSGLGSQSRSMRGNGKVEVTDGDVFAIPIFGPLSDLLGKFFPQAGYSIAHKATADFTVKQGVIHTENLNVACKLFGMLGHGDILFADDKLDMDVRINANGPGFVLLPAGRTGISFSNTLALDRYTTNQIYLNGSGVAAGDVDGDGKCDLFFSGLGGQSVLYRNLGDWRFADMTAAAGLALGGLDATGCVLADLDGDGDLDLVINTMGNGTHIFLNDGQGHFRKLPPLNPHKAGMSLAVGDVDGDGSLDIYIANYRINTIRDEPNTNLRIEEVDGQLKVVRVNNRPATEPDLVGRFSVGARGQGDGDDGGVGPAPCSLRGGVPLSRHRDRTHCSIDRSRRTQPARRMGRRTGSSVGPPASDQ